MAGSLKLTDVELLNLIKQTAQGSPKQVADKEDHQCFKEKDNVTGGQNASENLPVEKVETENVTLKSEAETDLEWQGEAQSVTKPVLSAELQPKSLFNVTSVAEEAPDLAKISSQQSGDKSLTNSLSQSSVKPSLQTVSQSKLPSPVNEVSKSNVISSLQTESQSDVTSEVKVVRQSDLTFPMKEASHTSVTSPVKGVSQKSVKSSVKEVSQASVTSPMKQVPDSETISPVRSLSDIDITSPSYKIDAEVVAMLSKEEVTNLVHEYRTELESTKKRLERSERQLAKANDYNNVLRNMVEKLSSEIHRLKRGKTCSVHVQVDKEDFLAYTTGRSSMPDWHAEDDHSAVPMDISHTEETVVIADSIIPQQPMGTDAGAISIADSVKQAAEAVVQKQQADMLHDSGYVYDEHSGLYYHPASGYYYDQQKSLFYDPKTGIYYYYDYNTGEYVFHSQVELPTQAQATEQAAVKVDIPFKKKYSDAKKSTKTTKTKKRRERHSSEERVYRNRRERRRAELEQSYRQRRKREDRYGRRYSRERDRKRKRYNSCSYSSGSSRSRSRTSSHDRGRRNSESRGRDKRSSSSHDRSNRSRRDRTRDNRSEKRYQNRKRGVSSESQSGESDVQIIEDNQTEKSKEKVKGRTKSLDNFDKRTKSKRSGDISKKYKSEELAESETGEDVECENSGIGDKTDILKTNPVDGYELESENELMIIEVETNDNENEDMVTKSTDENVTDTKKAHKEKETKHVHSKSSKSSRHSHRRSRSKKRRKYRHKRKSKETNRKEIRERERSGSEIESGELSDTNSENSSYSKSYSSSSSESDEEDLYVDLVEPDEQEEKEVAGSYPPCIRMMVVESDCLAIGSLYIVTCTGAKIGRENCDICIPDLNVSKVHAEIYYNEASSEYEIFDHASQNGTYLNNQRLSPAKIASEPFVVSHGDSVHLSTTKILCHIHPGSDTCDQCEPGVVIATHKAQQPQTELKVLSKEERMRQKKQELNQIKKKYGLKNSAYENNPEVFNNPNYSDKAEERRKHVGSDVPGQKSEAPASVHRPISTGNVGHKLLQKMGWKEGDSLGKNNTGIQEPISVTLRASQKAGLGSASAMSFSADDANTFNTKKATRRIQAQQRYKQIETETSENKDNVAKKLWTQGDTEFS